MKRFYFLFFNMMVACLFIACASTWDEPNLPLEATDSYYLHVNSETIEIPQSGSEQKIPITSKCYWTTRVLPNSEWISLSRNFGKGDDTLTISVAANISTTEIRSGTVFFNNGIEDCGQVTIIQEGADRPTISAIHFSNTSNTSTNCRFSFSSNHVVITEYGICYSSSTVKPEMGSSSMKKENYNGKNGDPRFSLTSLRKKTTYYVRAFVVSSLGIQYGNTYQFITQ